MTFGERLVYARERAGYKQNQFAEMLEITPTRLNYWEKDKRQPDVMMLWKIAKTLDVSGSWLLGLEEDAKKPPTIENGERHKKLQKAAEAIKNLSDEQLDAFLVILLREANQ